MENVSQVKNGSKIFIVSFNGASEGPISKLRRKMEEEDMLTDECYADYFLACGDRIETFDYCLNRMRFGNKKIIHLWAGEVSQGTHDEVYRWAITHMSCLQLCTNEMAWHRVRSFCKIVGKEPNAYVVGNVMLDNLETDESRVPPYEYDLVRYNPPTLLSDTGIMKEIESIFEMIGKNEFLWVPPNGDPKSELVWEHGDVNATDLTRPQFLGLMKHCNRFITNSSCAFYEAPFLMSKEKIILVGERNSERDSRYTDMTIPNASDNIIKILKEKL